MKARLVLTLAVVGVLVGPSALASGSPSVQSGWWTAAPVRTAPDAPPDGLVLQGGVDLTHPVAYGAIRFLLAAGTVPTHLTLTVAPGSASTPDAAVTICPLTASFTPAQGGAMADAPAFDCSTKATAAPSGDGKSYTFPVGALVRDGALAVALLPGAATDRVVLAAPGPQSLVVSQTGPAVTSSAGPTIARPRPGQGAALSAPARPSAGVARPSTTRTRPADQSPPTARPATPVTPVANAQPASSHRWSSFPTLAFVGVPLLAGALWLTAGGVAETGPAIAAAGGAIDTLDPRRTNMTPFMQLRLWWRRAPYANKASTVVAIGAVIALAGWALVPTGDNGTGRVRTSTRAAGSAAGTGNAGGAGTDAATGGGPGGALAVGAAGQGAGDAGGAGGAVASGPAASGCLPTPAGAPGVTDSAITIGFGYPNLAGAIGNSAVGLGSPDDYKRMAQAVVDDINANGGVQCRQLAFKAYEGNPINQDQTQATCMQVGQDAPLMFADAGAFVYPLGQYGCVPQQQIPLITVSQTLTSDIGRFAPYLASVSADSATEMTTAVFGAQQLGYFDPANGFKKLGLLEDDCTPEVNNQFEAALAKAAVAPISKYVFACPTGGFASPAEMGQAVVQFRRDGATHVVPLTGGGSFLTFSQIANDQGYKPKYLVTNYDGFLVTATSQTKPNGNNFDGALGITTGTYGMDTTPGFPVDPGTARCQDVLGRAGFPPTEVYGPQGGGVCSSIWAAAAAINHASDLTRESILSGLFSAGPVQLAYSYPDTTYASPSKYYGGDTWEAVVFDNGCSCWHITTPSRQPSFSP